VQSWSLTLLSQLAAEDETPPHQLVDKFRGLAHLPVKHEGLPTPTQPPAHLAKAELVYVLKDGLLPQLTPPYSGPHVVLARMTKFFQPLEGEKEELVSVDHLKAHTVEMVPPSRHHHPAAVPPLSLGPITIPPLPSTPRAMA
jgi:hypothetical protein